MSVFLKYQMIWSGWPVFSICQPASRLNLLCSAMKLSVFLGPRFMKTSFASRIWPRPNKPAICSLSSTSQSVQTSVCTVFLASLTLSAIRATSFSIGLTLAALYLNFMVFRVSKRPASCKQSPDCALKILTKVSNTAITYSATRWIDTNGELVSKLNIGWSSIRP